MSKTILLTGSSGVLGSFLRTELQRQGWNILGLDILGDGHDQGDILDYDHVFPLVYRCQGVIHCAALSRVLACESQPRLAHQVNVLGTQNIVKAVQNTKHKPWILFTSSREVYGSQVDLPVLEHFSNNPQNVYGKTKLQGEWEIQKAKVKGIRTSILRLTNLYGSPVDIPQRAIPSFVSKALRNEPISIVGEQRIFDFLQIQDVSDAIIKLLPFLQKQSLETLMLCSGKPITLGDIARQIVQQTNSKSQLQYLPKTNFEVDHFYGSSQRIKQYIDWSPKIKLEKGLQEYIQKMQQKELQ